MGVKVRRGWRGGRGGDVGVREGGGEWGVGGRGAAKERNDKANRRRPIPSSPAPLILAIIFDPNSNFLSFSSPVVPNFVFFSFFFFSFFSSFFSYYYFWLCVLK